MTASTAARTSAIRAAAFACSLLPVLAAGGEARPPAFPPPPAREILLDLPADFPPVICSGAIHLFSSLGRNQTMAAGESAPACNLLQLLPAVPPVCGPGGPLVLTKDGTLWLLGEEGPQSLQQGLDGAVAIAPSPGPNPYILFSDHLQLPSGESVSLPMEASRADILPGGAIWISGKGAGASVSADGRVLWTWKAGLSPTGAALGENLLAVGTEEGPLAVLDLATGRERYRYPTGGAIPSAPAVAGGLAIFGSRDHLVRAVRLKDGQLAWQVRLDGRPDFGPLLSRAGIIFAVSGGTTVVSLDPSDGRRTWTWRLPVGNILQSPACAGNQLAVLGWGEAETPALYLAGVPEPSPSPAPAKKKSRRAKPEPH